VTHRLDYSVSFNVIKSRCIFFQPDNRVVGYELTQLHIANKLVEYVKYWPHLGNIINNRLSDSECI
jgi:hypothetical protein